MPCLKPRPAWKATLPNESGKHSISFQFRDSEPDYWIGCTKCDGCTHTTKLEWAIRMHHEAMMHTRNSFITLTYANAPDAISRRDCQTFFKRLRKQWPTPIRYFITGEYGDKTHRPHYHAIIFGEDFRGGAYDINGRMYGNPYLNRIWRHGDCTVGDFTLGAAMYVAGYTAKKINDPDTFSLMSKNPPIGAPWLKQNINSLYQLKKIVVEGQEYPIPSAYFRWLAGDSELSKIKEEKEVNRLTDRQLDAKIEHFKYRKREKGEKI